MSGEPFTLDTNILVYSVDRSAGRKQALAAMIVDRAVERDCRLTLQALSEFYAAVTRKGIVPPADAAAQVADWLLLFPTLAPSATAVRMALPHAAAGRSSYWDGLLVATAAEGGCHVILTEDLADGCTIAGVTVHHPFAGDGLSAEATRLLGNG